MAALSLYMIVNCCCFQVGICAKQLPDRSIRKSIWRQWQSRGTHSFISMNSQYSSLAPPAILVFHVTSWRPCWCTGQKRKKNLLAIWFYYYAKFERYFPIALYANMAFSSPEWKPRIGYFRLHLGFYFKVVYGQSLCLWIEYQFSFILNHDNSPEQKFPT